MTHPMEPTTAELRLARGCAISVLESRLTGQAHTINMLSLKAKAIRAGNGDRTREVQSALAAIRATTEKAADWCDLQQERCEGHWLKRWNPFSKRWWWCAIAYDIASTALRAGQHLETTE